MIKAGEGDEQRAQRLAQEVELSWKFYKNCREGEATRYEGISCLDERNIFKGGFVAYVSLLNV